MTSHTEIASFSGLPHSTSDAPRPRSATERNWINSFLLVCGSVLVFYAGFLMEMDRGLWNREIRLVRDPSETAMRLTALSHFVVAILFMSTSRRMKQGKNWLWFFASLAIGLFLCFGYSKLGIVNPLFATTLFFAYFLIHDYRDQTFFYVANGDAIGASRRFEHIVSAAPLVTIGIGIAVLVAAAGFGIPGTDRVLPTFGALSEGGRYEVSALLLILSLATAIGFRGYWKSEFQGVPLTSVIRKHRPIFLVFAASTTVLATSAALGASGDWIILLHVCSWYIFTMHQLGKRAPAVKPAAFTWNWVRQTAAGFNFVHILSFLAFVAIAAVWSYVFRNNASLTGFAMTVGRDIFPYYTILHVTVSFPGR